MTQLEEMQREDAVKAAAEAAKPKRKGPCLYEPGASIKWVCVDANNDVYMPDGTRVNLHLHCQFTPCGCKHHMNEEGRDHTDCKCKKTRPAAAPVAAVPPVRRLVRPTPTSSVHEDSGPEDPGGAGSVMGGVRRRLVRPGQR